MTHLTAGILSLLAAQAGPVGYWRGDDGAAPTVAADSSGNNRNGTYTNGATTSTSSLPPGLFNNDSVFQLDGTNDLITVPHNAAFNLTGDMTVAFWIRKAVDPADWVRVIGKGATAVRTFGIWEEPGAPSRLYFQQYNGSGGALINLWSVGSINSDWTHVAVTVVASTNTATFYLNGAASGSGTRSGTPGVDTEPVRFGYAGYHTYFNGQLDEVRLFDRVLNSTEIQTLAGLVATETPGMPTFTNTTSSGTTVNWTAATGATSYVIKRSINGGAFVTLATGVTGLSYTDSPLVSGSTYTYRVYAVGLVNSADSTPNSVLIPFPPPRTNDHSEGLLDENCSCGSTAPGTSIPWAVLAALALVALRRR